MVHYLSFLFKSDNFYNFSLYQVIFVHLRLNSLFKIAFSALASQAPLSTTILFIKVHVSAVEKYTHKRHVSQRYYSTEMHTRAEKMQKDYCLDLVQDKDVVSMIKGDFPLVWHTSASKGQDQAMISDRCQQSLLWWF